MKNTNTKTAEEHMRDNRLQQPGKQREKERTPKEKARVEQARKAN